jgi:hypothetical protein
MNCKMMITWFPLMLVGAAFLFFFGNHYLSPAAGQAVTKTRTSEIGNIDTHLLPLPQECRMMSPHKWKIDRMGTYVRRSPLAPPPRYDHLSCFVMKFRYNCANQQPDHKVVASDYQLHISEPPLDDDNNANVNSSGGSGREVCDLPNLIEKTIGGPSGVAKRVLLSRRNNSSSEEQQRVHVLMLGNSYIRQVWEALVCGFGLQITDFKVQVRGLDSSAAGTKKRGKKLVTKDELGRSIDLAQAKANGCHSGPSNLSDSYREGSIVPPNMADCNDNVAMVEFGHQIRFYYIFHPQKYAPEALRHIYESWGLLAKGENTTGVVDVLVWNTDGKGGDSSGLLSWEHEIPGTWKEKLQKLQYREIGQFFGANNPWVQNPPDGHPCMPGVPDDEVNLLLLQLLLLMGGE